MSDGGRVGSTLYGRVWATAGSRCSHLKSSLGRSRSGPTTSVTPRCRPGSTAVWRRTRVAKWVGHSLAVQRVYAKCLDAGEQAARERVRPGIQRLVNGPGVTAEQISTCHRTQVAPDGRRVLLAGEHGGGFAFQVDVRLSADVDG
jgi:hypothetical protein